jgi:hypothetical protein
MTPIETLILESSSTWAAATAPITKLVVSEIHSCHPLVLLSNKIVVLKDKCLNFRKLTHPTWKNIPDLVISQYQ